MTPVHQRPLSRRQLDILEFIASRIVGGGLPPTIREIGARLGLESTSMVSYHLARLEGRGLIVRDGIVSRGLSVTPQARAEYPDLFPPTPAERVATAALEAQAAGEPLPARVVAALEAVA